jgi:hypothetical protein
MTPMGLAALAATGEKGDPMAIFFVRFEHPDEAGWQRWVRPHVDWLNEQVSKGTIIASGPSVGTTVRQGLLVMRAKDEPALIAVVQTDPFWINGIVENLQITQWDPLFGVFRDLSSNPEGPDLPA